MSDTLPSGRLQCETSMQHEKKFKTNGGNYKYGQMIDICQYILTNGSKNTEELFDEILADEEEHLVHTKYQGYVYERLCELLIYVGVFPRIEFDKIMKKDKDTIPCSFREMMNKRIEGQQGTSDIILITKENKKVLFSVKYSKTGTQTDVDRFNHTTGQKIALIVENKKNIDNIRNTKLKTMMENIRKDNLIFFKQDVLTALQTFQFKFGNMKTAEEVIEFVEKYVLNSPRKTLTLRLHQKLALLQFEQTLSITPTPKMCIAHKMRSGKSILMLNMCQTLLSRGVQKILMMTAVPATIDSFIQSLDRFREFVGIAYKTQECLTEDLTNFKGIVFTSIQYWKTNIRRNKAEYTKKQKIYTSAGFGAVFLDESHMGGSNSTTETGILNLCKNTKYTIFVSGTMNKTKLYYGIPDQFIFKWDTLDERIMKSYNKEGKLDVHSMECMMKRHGPLFQTCLNDRTLNKDYTKCPLQILLQHDIDEPLKKAILKYNQETNVSLGYSCSSLLTLRQQTENGEVEYETVKDGQGEVIHGVFELDHMKSMLKDFFNGILSNDPNRKTVMRRVEEVQSRYGSRQSTDKNPLMFIVYLPVGSSDISLLQKTIVAFLKDEEKNVWGDDNPWNEYNLEYLSSKKDSINESKQIEKQIEAMMEKTKKNEKKGCFLFLGNKGTTGITYPECDVTISLDDGHDLDHQKQKLARCMTETEGKTIGINVDMNVQRTLQTIYHSIHEFRENTQMTSQSNREILQYMVEHKLFLFNPDKYHFGNCSKKEITTYLDTVARDISENMDERFVLEHLKCEDELKALIGRELQKNKPSLTERTPELDGNHPDCPRPEKEKRNVSDNETEEKEGKEEEEKEEEKEIELINQTYELCRQFVVPLLALLSRSRRLSNFHQVLDMNEVQVLVLEKMNSQRDLTREWNMIKQIMHHIIDDNQRILADIQHLYASATPDNIRSLIERHFIPSEQERKQHAEISTPVELTEEMLKKLPSDFWTRPHTVFEPCCGKGVFVLAVFDLFFHGLESLIPDTEERCRVIVEECLYYADLNPLNVFITTELLKCHVEMYGGKRMELSPHFHVGDTLKLETEKEWGVEGFDLVVGNPPYNKSKDGILKGGYGGRSLWDKFVVKSLNEWVSENRYLVFIHPPSWRKPGHYLWKVLGKKHLVYLRTYSKKEGKKIFGCSTLVDYYVLKNTNIYKETIIDGQDGKSYSIHLNDWNFLPSGELDIIRQILGKNEVLYSSSIYDTRRPYVNKTKTETYNLPVVHNMTKKDGLGFVYSSEDKGHFGVSKVILSFGEFQYPYNDFNGEYGMSQICYGLKINSQEEGDKIVEAINSIKFKEILKYTKWSTFQTDWRMFKEFKKDFWKEFLE